MKHLDRLKAQRAKLDEEIAKAEKLKVVARKLEDFTDKEKCKHFDAFFKLADEYIKKRVEEGSVAVEDYPHWFLEAVVGACFGKDIWKQLPNN